MSNNYKGQNIAEMLESIEAMESRLRIISADTNPFSLAQFEELSHGYAMLAITKARLTSLQEERKQ